MILASTKKILDMFSEYYDEDQGSTEHKKITWFRHLPTRGLRQPHSESAIGHLFEWAKNGSDVGLPLRLAEALLVRGARLQLLVACLAYMVYMRGPLSSACQGGQRCASALHH